MRYLLFGLTMLCVATWIVIALILLLRKLFR